MKIVFQAIVKVVLVRFIGLMLASVFEAIALYAKFALLGKLEPHNISIQLKENIPANLPFGIKKAPKRILLYIHNAADFLKIVGDKIIENDTFLRTASLQLEKSM